MSETREIFTQRRKGVSQKEVRVKRHNEERKNKRQDLLLKRRMPTDAENDEEPDEDDVKRTPLEENAEHAKATAWEKSEQRKQQLLEWQAKRKAKKAEEAKSKKSGVVSSKQPVLHLIPVPNIQVSQPAMDVEKCAATNEINSTYTNNSSGSNTQQQKVSVAKRATRSQKEAAEKTIDAPAAPGSLKPNLASDKKLAATKQKVSSTAEDAPQAKPTTKKGKAVITKENVVDKKAPVRGKVKDAIEKKGVVVGKKIVEKKVGVVEKQVDVVVKKVGVVEKKEGMVEKKVGVAERKRGAVEKKVDVVEKKGKVVSKRPAVNTAEKPSSKAPEKRLLRTQPKKVDTETIDDNTNTTPQAESTTLSCADSSDNTHVKSPYNDSIEKSSSVCASTQDENQVPDLAWVPGYHATPKSKLPTNFSDAFGGSPLHSFSPFRFTGTKTPQSTQEHGCGEYKFTFSKALPSNPQDFVANIGAESSHSDMEPDSLMEQEGADDECGDERVNHERAGEKCGKESVREENIEVHREKSIEDRDPNKKKNDCSKEKCPRTGDEEQRIVDSTGEGGHGKSSAEDGSQAGCDRGVHVGQRLDKKASEIASFRKLHSDVVEKLTNLCQLWDQKSPVLSIPEDRKEEVLGQIRTTVCQAQLLMRQKLKQYIGLVGQTEHGGGEQPTKVEDLQGFWDMVYFQVEEMMKKFQELEDLEKNNWKVEETLEPAAKKRKKCAIPPPAAMESKSSLSEKQLAAREKREAARLKIKELKAMAVTKKSQDDEQSTPSCADKIESLSDAVKSASTGENAVPSSPLAPLMDFDTPAPSHPTPKHVKSTPRPPAPLSPESSLLSPLPAALLRTPKKAVDVPTAQLLSLTPARATPATPGKMESCEGAFKKMYVAVTPSKKLRQADAHPELTGDDVVMSEARRSVRLAHKGSCTPRHQVVVSSLAELPDDIDFSYCPPSQL